MTTLPFSAVANQRRRVVTVVFTSIMLSASLAACRAESRPRPDSSGASAAATPTPAATTPAPSAAAGTFALSDFRHLRWIDGSWRGQLPDGKYFYERYRIVDDSTIAMQGFSDSTYTTVSDSSRIALRGTTVASEGPSSRWEATRLDSTSVEFVSTRNPSSGFTWQRESADRWTATIRSGGRPNTVYNMERVKR